MIFYFTRSGSVYAVDGDQVKQFAGSSTFVPRRWVAAMTNDPTIGERLSIVLRDGDSGVIRTSPIVKTHDLDIDEVGGVRYTEEYAFADRA